MSETILISIRSYFSPSFDWIPPIDPTSQVDPTFSQQFAGKLLLKQEMPLDDSTFETLLSSKTLYPIAAIEKHIWGHHCRRCGNRSKHLFADIPCARCQTTHVYCRKCVEMGRVLACESLYYWIGPPPTWNKQEAPCAWIGTLTTHQQAAADQIKDTMMKNGEAELLVWAVCGAGKTEMLFQGIEQSIQQMKRVCLATPRADVVRELLPRFRQAFPNTEIEGLYGGSEQKEGKAQLIIATTHQLLRYARAFDVLIIDEVDAFPYHADPSLPFAAKRAAKTDVSMIYLTATPRRIQRKRSEANKLPTVFVPVRFHGHPLPVPTFQMCYSLRKTLQTYQVPASFIKWYKRRLLPKRQLVIFVPTIELAERITGSIVTQLSQYSPGPITFVHASDPDREAKVQQFRDRKLSILVTTTILERGVTFPSVDVVVLDAGHSVFDEAALVQIAGRAGRSPADPTGEVIFYHDGKTDAMVHAVRSIQAMNKRGRKL